MCLASALQFHDHASWQMPAIRTMWSLTIWPPCHVDTEAKQNMRNCQTRCQRVACIVPGLSESAGHCLSKSPHHSGQLVPTDTHTLNSSGLVVFLLTHLCFFCCNFCLHGFYVDQQTASICKCYCCN